MTALTDRLLTRWHALLDLPRQPAGWYPERLREELRELREARTRLERLSEAADVHYSIGRARHDGHPVLPPPLHHSHRQHHYYYHHDASLLPRLYMVGKYSSRWAFYRAAAWWCGGGGSGGGRGRGRGRGVREVVNPRKDAKLREVALRHGIDPARFQRVCRGLLRVWPLLP